MNRRITASSKKTYHKLAKKTNLDIWHNIFISESSDFFYPGMEEEYQLEEILDLHMSGETDIGYDPDSERIR